MSFNKKVKNIHIFNHSKRTPNKFVPEYARWFQNSDEHVENQFWMFGDGDELEGFSYRRYTSKIKMMIALFFARDVNKYIFHSTTFSISALFAILNKNRKYLILWGGELREKEASSIRSRIANELNKVFIKNMHGYLTHIEEDFKRACLYGGNSSASWIKASVCYPSNTIKEILSKREGKVKILIGTSALPRNNHIKIIDSLKKMDIDFDQVQILIPLSYGEKKYAKEVVEHASSNLKEFTAIFDFMAYDEYMGFLSSIDIALFGNIQQQGMGNSINLLSFGCKLFFHSDSENYKYFKELGFKLYELDDFNNEEIKRENISLNVEKAKKLFSENTLKREMNKFLERNY